MAKKNNSKGNAKKSNPQESSNIDFNLPKDFKKKTKTKFDKIKNKEILFSEFLEVEKQEFQRLDALKQNPSAKYKPKANPEITPCGNGDFEKELDPNQWQGAYGDVRNIPSSFTEGFISGAIDNFNSHQTWVGTGPDPHVPISTTAPGLGGAVRIGNSVPRYGAELISKTFVVTPMDSTITFWYATVMQIPTNHETDVPPLFWVRVTDANGAIVNGAFDFGNGSDKLIANRNNPFFKNKGDIVYKDWSCAQIDLSTQVGKQVTIEFITGDCGFGGHWGYAYIDRYCGTCEGSPTGTLNYDCEESDHCGVGEICFDYTLPFTEDDKGDTITGSVDITLDIYQNGTLITSLTSPTLSNGNRYCFPIDPASISEINPALGGFDFIARGEFSIISFSLGQIKIGAAPDGINIGQNNDYKIECKTCSDIKNEQESHLYELHGKKVNKLESYNCNCPDTRDKASCGCSKGRNNQEKDHSCKKIKLPKMEPCISISWGDSLCDCMETTDFEVACITIYNCYENVSFDNIIINKIIVTDENGKLVDTLPNDKPSLEIIPSGPICFGDIPPCSKGKASYKIRELVINVVAAKRGKYRLKLQGVCYQTRFNHQKDYCFDLKLCGD